MENGNAEVVVENVESAPVEEVVQENAEEIVDENVEVESQPVLTDDFLKNFNLDDLLSADFSEDEVMSKTHRDLPSYQEVLKHLPENGRKLISNLRAMTTRKTQEVADIRKQLEAERAAVAQEREALYNGEFAKKIQSLAQEPEQKNDLYTDEGLQAEIQRQAALMFQQMMQPVQQDMALQQRQMQLDNFKRDNPEITNPEVRIEVAQLLKARPELKLEDAFYITKAKMDQSKLVQLQAEAAQKKSEQRQAWKKTSNGAASKPKGSPKFRSAWEAFQYHKANGAK